MTKEKDNRKKTKQHQERCIPPMNLDVELPLIREKVLRGIEGLTTKNGFYYFKGKEYKLGSVVNADKGTGTELYFINTQTQDIILCRLYRGFYIVQYDGFNNLHHTLTDEEKKEYKKDYYKYYYRNRTIAKRKEEREANLNTCPICGKKFVRSNRFRKYCSEECQKEAMLRKLRVEKGHEYSRVCPVCGKRFFAVCKTQKFCSRKCYIKNRNDKHSKQNKLTLQKKLKESIIKV